MASHEQEKHPNLSAYDDVENLQRFTDESFENYCRNKMKECAEEVNFIREKMVDGQWQGRICEVGSGNSKLLYSLEQEGLLQTGIGYETSKSRNIFAEKFRKHINSTKVQNICNDFLKETPEGLYDLVIGVDIVFQFIAPLYPEAEKNSLDWVKRTLRPGGHLLLELRDFADFDVQIKNSPKEVFHFWEEFPEPDPFEFVLAKMYYDENKSLCWDKTFLERNSGKKSKFVNILKLYKENQISDVLRNAGFDSIKIYHGFSENTKSETYIVTAQKP
jgi:SAM-dependent methyltransferase